MDVLVWVAFAEAAKKMAGAKNERPAVACYVTCMHRILPPLLTLARLVVERRATGRLAVDLSPWNGATAVADEAIMVGAMAGLASNSSELRELAALLCCLLLGSSCRLPHRRHI
jgi:hypothetical protein